jgi:hypothetical protein
MRFLMVAMQYPTETGQSYLTTELADGLVKAGHELEVLHLDWHNEGLARSKELWTQSGIRVVRCAATSLRGLGPLIRDSSKFLLSGERAARAAHSKFDLSNFDAVIAWMPASALGRLVRLFERAGIAKRLLFIGDFFPDHAHEIGRLPGGLPLRLARAAERRLVKRFTALICTLPGNADYLRQHFRLTPSQRVLIAPIWGEVSQVENVDVPAVRERHLLPQDLPIAVFGGQLIEGRGFEQMLGAADAALAAGSSLRFLFIGNGRLAAMIQERSVTQANILYRPSIPRSDFLELLGACNVGMVATVPGVSSFSIPSKTIDYLRAGLPIVAAVEHGNDYLQILRRYDVGSGVPFGEPRLYFDELERLAARGSIKVAARRCLEDVFDVRHAVATVLEASDGSARISLPRSAEPSMRMPRHRRSVARAVRPS